MLFLTILIDLKILNKFPSNIFANDNSTSFNSLSYKSIEKSVNNVYGENKRTSWDYRIINIERGYYPEPYLYRLTIEFETFTGAHKPPVDTNVAVYDIISFDPTIVKEISYEHYLNER